jgi:hypothetical protein
MSGCQIVNVMEIGIEDTSTELGFMWMELGEHPFYLKNGTEDG